MSKVVVWTDKDEKVTRIHYNPSEVDTTNGFVVKNKPHDSVTDDWIDDSLYYSQNRGFYYESNDPFDGLNLSDNDKKLLYKAVINNNLSKVRNIVERAMNL